MNNKFARYVVAVAICMAPVPAMAANFILQSGINSEGNGWFTAPNVGNGGYVWDPIAQKVNIVPLSFDDTLTFNVATDSLIKINLWQSESGFTFSNIYFNNVSIVSNLSSLASSNPGSYIGQGYAAAGPVSIRFVGTNVGNPHSFGGNINVQAATLPSPAIPEPATWAMMIIGLGSIGFMMRGRSFSNRVSKICE